MLSELRDWPRHDLTEEVEAFANAAWEALTSALSEPVGAGNVEWYLRHGQFSTYDDAGPESLTQVDLAWQEDRWNRVGGWQAYQLLDDADAGRLLNAIDDVHSALEQVEPGFSS